MTVPAKQTHGDIMDAVIVKGDLSKLTADERVDYYNAVCRSIGVNPLTRPLEFITLQGKMVLYAKRDCADQLRKLNGISVEIVSQEVRDDLLTVHVRAVDRDGRKDEDLGVVSFPEMLRGEIRANTILKAVTKAKRRVTLSISGLGFLDETEVEDIPAEAKTPPKPTLPKPPPHKRRFDLSTDQLPPPATTGAGVAPPAPSNAETTPGAGGARMPIEAMAREAAMRGHDVLAQLYRTSSPIDKLKISDMQRELEALYPGVEPEDD